MTYLLILQHPRDAARTTKLVAFLKWAETEGQKMARNLNIAPLPESVTSRVLGEIESISPHS